MNGIKHRSADEMKDSGIEWIGKIPKEWFHRKIKFNSYVKGRIGWQGLKADEFIDSGPFLVTGTDFQHNSINWHTCYHVTDLRFLEAPEIHLRNDDLLITKDGTIGKLAIVQNCPEKAVLNSGIFVCRCMNQDYITRYLLYVLCSNVFSHFYELESGGSTIKHLYQETFENFAFPLQGLDEQRKIANFLDIKTAQFDSIIAKKEQLITKLEEAKKSLISEVVTGKVKIVDGQLVPRPPEEMKDSGVEWLGMIPNEWSLPKLKYHSVRITQGPNPNYEKNIPTSERFKVLKTKDLYDKEILYSQADNISEMTFKECQKSKLLSGDIMMGIVGKGSIGKVNVFECIGTSTYIFTRALGLIRVNDRALNPWFINYLFLSHYGKEIINIGIIGSTGQEVLQTAYISNIYIVKPTLLEQTNICAYLNESVGKIDQLIESEKNQLILLKSAKQSLISEAVTGKIDLRDWEIIEQGGAS